EDLERTLRFIGGVKERGSWLFPYEPTATFDSIVSMGLIPEVKSHQFYPTPASIAQYVAQILKCTPTDRVLEPSAGRGDLLAFLNATPENVTCVEISPLFCDILSAKGYDVHNKDFIDWSKQLPYDYDKIAINPPYSEGRAKEHTLTALNHLSEDGMMAAVLPAGYKPEEWIGNQFVCAKSGREFSGEFEDTGITVAVFVFKRA
ncbi:TPA: DNA modification methylase, partial [Klebsiella pneumoniae]